MNLLLVIVIIPFARFVIACVWRICGYYLTSVSSHSLWVMAYISQISLAMCGRLLLMGIMYTEPIPFVDVTVTPIAARIIASAFVAVVFCF
jgi:hypothetical protein